MQDAPKSSTVHPVPILKPPERASCRVQHMFLALRPKEDRKVLQLTFLPHAGEDQQTIIKGRHRNRITYRVRKTYKSRGRSTASPADTIILLIRVFLGVIREIITTLLLATRFLQLQHPHPLHFLLHPTRGVCSGTLLESTSRCPRTSARDQLNQLSLPTPMSVRQRCTLHLTSSC